MPTLDYHNKPSGKGLGNSGAFRAVRLPGQVTRAAEPLYHS